MHRVGYAESVQTFMQLPASILLVSGGPVGES